MKFIKWRNWNDQLSLLLMASIMALWILEGMGRLTLSVEVRTASIMGFTLVLQYYFRQAPPTEPPAVKPPV